MFFYKEKSTGAIVIADRALAPNADWEELRANTTDASGEKHVPVVEKKDGLVSVKVGSAEHPMLDVHYIMWIVLETNLGFQKKDLRPGMKPAALFALAEGETAVAAYEYCNLHGLWKADA